MPSWAGSPGHAGTRAHRLASFGGSYPGRRGADLRMTGDPDYHQPWYTPAR